MLIVIVDIHSIGWYRMDIDWYSLTGFDSPGHCMLGHLADYSSYYSKIVDYLDNSNFVCSNPSRS